MSGETIVANPWDQSTTDCAHCGQMSKTIWGDISEGGIVKAIYYVTWTVGDAAHDVNVDLVIGPWEGAPPESRKLAALLYRPATPNGSSVLTAGPCGRPAMPESPPSTLSLSALGIHKSPIRIANVPENRDAQIMALCAAVFVGSS